MKWFLFWSGAAVLVVVLALVVASRLYPQKVACDDFAGRAGPGPEAEESSTPVAPEWYVRADCQGVRNDLSVAYYVLGVAAALVGVGFVVRRGG